MLNEYGLAVKDYDFAIRLNPGYAMAYYNRGIVYVRFLKDPRGYDDIKRAANMGYKDAEDFLASKGMNR